MNIQRMMREEAVNMEQDLTQNGLDTFKGMDQWRRVLKKAEGEEEEILQTKIVGLEEMIRDLYHCGMRRSRASWHPCSRRKKL